MAKDPNSSTSPHPGFAAHAVSGGTGKPHPGFAAVQSQIASKQGIPMANAGAILASSSRKASASAKMANPKLNKVKGY